MIQKQVYRGTLVDYIRNRYARCRHYHVSGRRCGTQISKSQELKYCEAHKQHPRCTECESMKLTFIPPKGW